MYEVHLLDRFTQIGELTGFELVEAIETDLKVGHWRVVFDPIHSPSLADAARNATWLGIEIYNPDTGHRYGGEATQRRRVYRQSSEPTLIELRGVDMMDYLAAPVEWPDTTDVDRMWVTTNSSLQLSTAVTNNLFFQAGGGALPFRQIPSLNIVTPAPPFGPVKNWDATRRPILDTWAPFFEGTPWTMRMQLNRTGVAQTGEIRFEPVERATTNIVISPQFHDGDIEVIETAAAATHVIVMGDNDPGAIDPNDRFVADARAAELNWLEKHREKFVSRPSASQAVADDEAVDLLAANGPRLAVQANDVRLPTYGSDAFIGDYVTVSFSPTEPTLLAPITEARIIGTPDGWSQTVTIGAEGNSPAALLMNRIDSLASEVRRIEGDR